MNEPNVSNRFSRDVIDLLIERGMNVTRIASLLAVSKSYISRVKAGKRSLTLDHLAVLERKLGSPVALLLMESIPRDTVAPKARPLYDATLRLLRRMAEPVPRASRKPAPSPRRKPKQAKAA